MNALRTMSGSMLAEHRGCLADSLLSGFAGGSSLGPGSACHQHAGMEFSIRALSGSGLGKTGGSGEVNWMVP